MAPKNRSICPFVSGLLMRARTWRSSGRERTWRANSAALKHAPLSGMRMPSGASVSLLGSRDLGP